MVQKHLAATVESVLTLSKPGKTFTGAVLAGVAGLSAKTATAAGVTHGAASVANAVSSTGGAASGLGSLWLGPILQLPVLGWLYKTSYADMRMARPIKNVPCQNAETPCMKAFSAIPMGHFLWDGPYVTKSAKLNTPDLTPFFDVSRW